MPIRPPIWIVALAAVAVGVSACGGGSGQTAATSSSPGTTGPTSSVRPTNPAVTAQPGPRTVVDLESALLELKDLPPGFAITPAGAGGDDSGAVSSKDPKCAPMVNLTNPDHPPGSKASAKVSFSGGQNGPFFDESIDSLSSADAVKALQGSLRSAVAACTQLTMTIPGLGSSTMTVAEVTAPTVGDHPFAVRMTGISGRMKGLAVTQVTSGVQGAVVSVIFVLAKPQDVDGASKAAVGKAQDVLGGAMGGA
jgi:hypothetical protein